MHVHGGAITLQDAELGLGFQDKCFLMLGVRPGGCRAGRRRG